MRLINSLYSRLIRLSLSLCNTWSIDESILFYPANNQGHDSTDVDSLYKFSQMARVLIHLIFGHLTPMVLAVLNGCLSRTVLTLIHLKRASKC